MIHDHTCLYTLLTIYGFCTDDICTWYDEDSSHQFPLVTKRLFRGFHRVFLAIFKSGTMIRIVRKTIQRVLLKNRNYTGNRVIETGIIRGQQKMNNNQCLDAHRSLQPYLGWPSDEPRISLGGIPDFFGLLQTCIWCIVRNSYWATVQCRYALIVQHVLVFHPWSCPRIPGNIFKAVGDFCSAWFLTPALGFQKLNSYKFMGQNARPFSSFSGSKTIALGDKISPKHDQPKKQINQKKAGNFS